MADELPYGFDAEGARRIVEAVRRIEAMPRDLRRGVTPPPQPAAQPFWLVQTSAYRANGDSNTGWTIYSGSTKGSETATSYTTFSQKIYVRKGLCFASVTYTAYFVDGIWEVLDPTLSGIGKTNASHAKGASGTINLYTGTLGSETSLGSSITAWNRYADVASGKWVRWAWNDDSSGFELVAAEC